MRGEPTANDLVDEPVGDLLASSQMLMENQSSQERRLERAINVAVEAPAPLGLLDNTNRWLSQLVDAVTSCAPRSNSTSAVLEHVMRRPSVDGAHGTNQSRCDSGCGTMRRRVIAATALVAAITVGACSNDGGDATTAPLALEDEAESREPPTGLAELPEREGERRATTGGVPHIQIDAAPVPAVDAELRRRAFQLPGVENRESDRSLPGARGLALADDVDLARPDVIAGSSEFAHIHPDGSLHVWLPVDRAVEVDRTKWDELHPWVDRDGFWDGVVMIYTPETLEELDITIRILIDAYNFVAGASLEPADIT